MQTQLKPTLETLAAELKKRFFTVEVCKGFLAVKYTKAAPKIGYAVHGLEVHFGRKLCVTHSTDKGFYIAFYL